MTALSKTVLLLAVVVAFFASDLQQVAAVMPQISAPTKVSVYDDENIEVTIEGMQAVMNLRVE